MDIPYVDIRLSKICLLTDISQQLPSGSIRTRELHVTLLSIPAARAPGIDLRMPTPQTAKSSSLRYRVCAPDKHFLAQP